MSLELARIWVRVRGDTSMLASDLSEASSIVRRVLDDPRAWAAGMFLPFATFGDAFIEHGRRIAAANEQTRISFRVLMGDVAAADALMAQLIDYAAHTPFELPQLFAVTQGLVAFGDRGREVMRTLKMIGDVSGGVHEKFMILGSVFNQIRGVEVLLSQDFKQLSMRGMLFITDIAKYLGVTKQEADRLQRTGKITFEDVKGTLMMLTTAGHRFHNMMELQSQTIIGLTATLTDSWGIFASKVADSLIPLDRVILRIKINLVGAMGDLVDVTEGFAAGALVGAVAASKLALAILAVSVALRILRLSWKAFFIGTGWGAVIIGIGAALGGLIGWFTKSTEGIQAAADASNDLSKVWQNLRQVAHELITSINEGLLNAFGVNLAGALALGSAQMGDWVRMITEWLLYLSEVAVFAAGGIGFAFRNAWDLLAIGGIDLFIDIISLFQRLEAVAYQVATTLMKVFAAAFAFIEAAFTNLLNNFKAIGNHIKVEWIALTELLKGLNEGLGWDEATARANAAAKKAEEEKPKDLIPFEEAMKAFVEEQGISPDGPLLDEEKKALQEERDRLQERINDRENARRDERPKAPDSLLDEEGKAKEQRSIPPLIEAGRYGFVEFGRKIQDAMLKGKEEDQAQQMIDLLGRGNNIQQRVLDEQIRNRGLAQ